MEQGAQSVKPATGREEKAPFPGNWEMGLLLCLVRGLRVGMEGWEAVNVYAVGGTGKVTIVAKRPLTQRARRLRSMAQM